MRKGVYVVVNLGNTLVPARVVQSAMTRIRPIDGHIGDGEEPEQEVPPAAIQAMAGSDIEALKLAGFELDPEQEQKLEALQQEQRREEATATSVEEAARRQG